MVMSAVVMKQMISCDGLAPRRAVQRVDALVDGDWRRCDVHPASSTGLVRAGKAVLLRFSQVLGLWTVLTGGNVSLLDTRV